MIGGGCYQAGKHRRGRANVDKFTRATDWQPLIPFNQTMADLLGYWRERVRVLGMQPVGSRT